MDEATQAAIEAAKEAEHFYDIVEAMRLLAGEGIGEEAGHRHADALLVKVIRDVYGHHELARLYEKVFKWYA